MHGHVHTENNLLDQHGTGKVMISLLRWLFVMDKKFAYLYQVFAAYAKFTATYI